MADITKTSAQIGLVDPAQAETYDFEKAEDLELGDAIYMNSNGKLAKADANAAGLKQFAGIVVAKQGRGVTVLKRGRAYGFDLSGLAYFAPVYLSDTAGAIGTAAGTLAVNVGKVVPMSDSDKTKVLYVDADWLRVWS